MTTVAATASIPESFLEHRQSFANSWVERWVLPNPFITGLERSLKELGVGLADFSFNRDATTVADNFLNVSIRKLSAEIKIGLDSVTFRVANPDWTTASQLASAFEQVTETVHRIVQAVPVSQESVLLLHVTSETVDFQTATASFVNLEALADASFYGISLQRASGTVMIDKSVRYENGAFIRIQHRFAGEDSFAGIAARIYEDELFALSLLGLVYDSGD